MSVELLSSGFSGFLPRCRLCRERCRSFPDDVVPVHAVGRSASFEPDVSGQDDGFADCVGLSVPGLVAVLCEDECTEVRERVDCMLDLVALAS
ncbi:MAG: hypothetical protein OXF56_02985 [Rhodobacteraceae bacterium]|nr:hypothetical protein [Paracoccaceae bacterium]